MRNKFEGFTIEELVILTSGLMSTEHAAAGHPHGTPPELAEIRALLREVRAERERRYQASLEASEEV